MPLGAQFTLGAVDEATPVILGVDKAFGKLVETVKGEVGPKLKSIFTMAAFEEATRRTGEWAQQYTKAAQAMGITVEHLQSLNLLANQSNVEQDKVSAMLDEMDAKRREALAGNQDLIYSFNALGASFEDLQHMSKGDLFGKILQSPNIKNLVAGTGMGNAMESITHVGSIPTVQALANTMGGKSFNQFSNDAKENGSIVSNDDMDEMSEQWKQIKQDLADALKTMTPIGKFLLGFATILSELVLGLGVQVKNVFDIITGLFTGNTDLIKKAGASMGKVMVNAVFGVVNVVTGLLDTVASVINSWIRKIPGMKKLVPDYQESGGITGLVKQGEGVVNDAMGSTRSEKRGGEGIGQAATIVGAGGTGALARGGTGIMMDAAGMAEKIGAGGLSGRLLGGAVKLDKWSQDAGFVGKLMRKGNGVEDDLKAMQRNTIASLAGTTLGTIGAIASQQGLLKGQTPNKNKDAAFNGIIRQQAPTIFSGESTGNLKIGGVFGSGFQARIIKLNEQMLQQLSAIARNTQYNPNNVTPINNNNQNPNGFNTGGI